MITQLKNLKGNNYYVNFSNKSYTPTEEFNEPENTFEPKEDISVIISKGSGCILLVPKKRESTNIKAYKNIISFVKEAEDDQVNKLFDLIDHYINLGYYVSTHGRTVNWIHVRVENIPKYS